jgi:hypothetical protein
MALKSEQYSALWTTWRDSTMFPTGLQLQSLGINDNTKDQRSVEVLIVPFRVFRH